MSGSVPQDDDEILARLLEEYDVMLSEQVSSGFADTEFPDTSFVGSGTHLAREWYRAKHSLEVLHQANPLGIESPADYPADSDDSRSIGRFLIRRELGCGGMGVVFLADDLQLKRQVAVKVPRAGALFDSALRNRFLREAEAAARLSHPGIVQVFEVGRQGPICFIASEYCSGPTLRDWIARRNEPVPVRQAAKLVLRLARAVQHAHSRGVLHRDLKPANVMLEYPKPTAKGQTREGRDDLIPKLTDFGMAKLMELDSNATCTGMRIGTLCYMSPEQAEGHVKDLDARTDVYALGSMLYELLTGRPPFVGETTTETLFKVITEEPLPPSRLRPKLSADLEAVCMKCLEKPLASRYASAAAFEEDLDRWLQGRTTVARPIGPTRRLWKYCRRRPVTATLTAVSSLAFFALLLGGWLYGEQMRRAALREKDLRQTAATNLGVAEQNGQKALAEKHKANELLWISKVHLAHEEWKSSQIGPFSSLLGECQELVEKDRESMFAWKYLKRLQHLEEISLNNGDGHKFAVTFLDDHLLAVGDESGHATLWSLPKGEVLGELEGHTSCLNSISLSSDEQYIASASCDETIRIFNRSDYSLLKVLRSPHGAVGTVRFLKDSHTLVSISIDDVVAFWDMDRGQILDTILTNDPSSTVAIGRQGDLIIRATPDGRVQWWRRSDPAEVKTVGLPRVKSLAVNHAGTQIAAGSADGLIWIWHPDDKTPGEMLPSPSGVWGLTYSRDDKTLAAACSDYIVRLWSIKERRLVEAFKGHHGRINELCFSPTGRKLASASDDNFVKIWRVGTTSDFARLETPSEEPICSSVSSDGRFFAFGQSNGAVTFRKNDSSNSTLLPQSVGRDAAVSNLCFSQDSKFLSAYWNDGWLRIWSLVTDKPRLLVDRSGLKAYDVCGSSKLVVLNGQDASKLVVESWDGSLETQRFSFPDTVKGCLFGPRGRFLVVGTVAGNFICNLQVGSISRLVANFDGWPSRFAFSRDGRMVAVAAGNALAIWNTAAPERAVMLRGHTETVSALAFSPDGLEIASGANDKTIRLWHIPSGQEMIKLEGHESGIVDLAFSADGNKLYSIAKDDGKPCSIFSWPTTRQDSRDQSFAPGTAARHLEEVLKSTDGKAVLATLPASVVPKQKSLEK